MKKLLYLLIAAISFSVSPNINAQDTIVLEYTKIVKEINSPFDENKFNEIDKDQFATPDDPNGFIPWHLSETLGNQAMVYAIERYDTLLNTYYTICKEQLCKEQYEQLLNAQRSWLKYRDTSCKLLLLQNGADIADLMNYQRPNSVAPFLIHGLPYNNYRRGAVLEVNHLLLNLYKKRVEELINIISKLYNPNIPLIYKDGWRGSLYDPSDVKYCYSKIYIIR